MQVILPKIPKRRAIWIFISILLLYPISYGMILSTKDPYWDVFALKSRLNNPIQIIEWDWQPFGKLVDPSPFNGLCRGLFTPLTQIGGLI